MPDALLLCKQWNDEPPGDELLLRLAASFGAWRPAAKVASREDIMRFVENATKCGVM